MLPQTPSRFTGTIGAFTPFMILSMPRRNGRSWPIRVIWPSAKMQTTSPLRMASLASRREWIMSRGRSGEEQERVNERHVIGDEQGAAGFGDVVAAFDADAIDGMGDHEEDQAEEGIW